MDNRAVEIECDRFVKTVLLPEQNPDRQVVLALEWIIKMGESGLLDILPPLNAMLGLTKKETV